MKDEHMAAGTACAVHIRLKAGQAGHSRVVCKPPAAAATCWSLLAAPIRCKQRSCYAPGHCEGGHLYACASKQGLAFRRACQENTCLYSPGAPTLT